VELGPLADEPRLIAGLDAAFSLDERWCLGAAVLWDLASAAVLEVATASRRLRFPYVPGLLSFREAPALLAALRKLRRAPDLLLCDGQGIAHPRRFGIACHLGVWLGLPAVGCAKSRLVGEHEEPAWPRGSVTPLLDRAAVVGAVVRTRDGVRPLYVSPGHRIDVVGATRLVLACATRCRLPEPTRIADQEVARFKRSYQCPSGLGGGPISSG
jgi:deoxyribonuclease V